MIPGDSYPFTVRRQTIGAAVSPGKVLADFTIGAYQNGVVASVSPTVTEIGTSGNWTAYKISVTIPAGEGILDLTIEAAAGTDVVTPATKSVEIESYDLKSAVAIFAVPIVSVVTQGGPTGDLALRIVKNTYAVISFTARDTAGAAFDLSTWNNGKFNVMSQNQTTTIYTQATASMTAGGVVTVNVPETATFYAALTTGNDEVSLYWNVLADDASDATKTRCLARGRLTVVRTEI